MHRIIKDIGNHLGTALLCLLLPACLAQQVFAGPAETEKGVGPTGISCTLIRNGADRSWIFYPSATSEKDTLPLTIFLPGYNGFQPEIYGGWIDHLVQRKSVVIFVQYQHSLIDIPGLFYNQAVGGINAALDELDTGSYPQTDRSRALYIGHSLGATVAMKLIDHLDENHAPSPYSAILAHPGSGQLDLLQEDTYDNVPANALLLCFTGESDFLAGDDFTQKILKQTPSLPAAYKYHFRLLDDDHGKPAIRSAHLTPCSYLDIVPLPMRALAKSTDLVTETDLSDTAIYWKTSALLLEMMQTGKAAVAFSEKVPELIGEAGTWPDGVPVKALIQVPVG